MKRRRKCGIYKILNQTNGKIYIGSAVNLSTRWREHVWQLRRSIHSNRHLQSAWIKYGEDAFGFEVLEKVDDEEKLVEREQFYLDQLRPFDDRIGYNICAIAYSTLGVPCSPEKAAKLAVANTGRRFSAEVNAKKARWGQSPTEETREKLRQAMIAIGNRPPREAVLMAAEARRGKPLSAEQREKQSLAMKANLAHHEHLRALNDKTRGVSTILTDEQIEKLLADRASGMSYVALGKKYGVSNVTCKNWCVRKGIAPTPTAPAPLSPKPQQLALLL
jgi:group I intron endonuclease